MKKGLLHTMKKLANFIVIENNIAPEHQKTSCLIIGLMEKKPLSPIAKQIDKATQGTISALLKKGDISGKVGETLLLASVAGIKAERLLLVGCGDNTQYQKIIESFIPVLTRTPSTDALVYLSDFTSDNTEKAAYWTIRRMIDITHQTLYTFNDFKTQSPLPTSPVLQTVTFAITKGHSAISLTKAKGAIQQAIALSEAISHTKDLGNMPPNICTPTYLASYAQNLSKKHKKMTVSILEKKDMVKLKMGLLLSVAQGSKEPPKFIILNYKGLPSGAKNNKTKPIVLVGKGITFDTGGNSLKPSAFMVGMKYDMCGAATVLGVLEFASQMNLPVNIIGLIPTCENMPGGESTRPDDIVTSMAGITVEIINTDAEGRLILADALTYAERYNPDVVIDIATLTGACVAALGHHASGLLSNHPVLTHELIAAGLQTHDRAWEFPLWPEYESILSSKFADIANANVSITSNAGTITAACFLAKFTQKYHWAHLDVAGTACYFGGENKGATGRPVSLLVQYLLNKIELNKIEHHA